MAGRHGRLLGLIADSVTMVTESAWSLPCAWVFGIASAFSAAQRGHACINNRPRHAPPRHQGSEGQIAVRARCARGLRSCPRVLCRCVADGALTPSRHIGIAYWEAR